MGLALVAEKGNFDGTQSWLMHGHEPSPESVVFRQNLAKLLAPLRRVRPRVPFFKLAVHTVPTQWGLYRGLLRAAPTDNIKFRVRMLFRQNQHQTGVERTRKNLVQGYKWLHIFTLANGGDAKSKSILERYDRFIGMKREKAYWMDLVRKEVDWQRQMKNRPILTGGLILPTMLNSALPRMKPQPQAIAGMILNRRKIYETRRIKRDKEKEWRQDIMREAQFEEGLAKEAQTKGLMFERVYSSPTIKKEWDSVFVSTIRELHEADKPYFARAQGPIPPALLEQVRIAKRDKVLNKTKERERERRGEILRSTLRRARQGLPARLILTTSAEKQAEDKLVRGNISDVGYLGTVKARRGWRVREGRAGGVEGARERAENKRLGKRWSIEDGEWVSEAETLEFQAKYDKIQAENESRQIDN